MGVAAPLEAPLRRRGAPAPGAHLRVVREQERVRRVSGVAVACASVAGVLVLLFVLAVLQTAIAQGQAHLDDIRAQTSARQSEAQALRLEVAQLESPARIIGEAESRLGMVEPSSITYVQAVDPSEPLVVSPVPSAGAAGDPAPAGESASGDADADVPVEPAEAPPGDGAEAPAPPVP